MVGERIKRRIPICDTQKLFEIQISVSIINKVLSAHSYTRSCMNRLWLLCAAAAELDCYNADRAPSDSKILIKSSPSQKGSAKLPWNTKGTDRYSAE